MHLNTSFGRVLIEMKGMGVNRALSLGAVISRALWYETKAHVLAILFTEISLKHIPHVIMIQNIRLNVISDIRVYSIIPHHDQACTTSIQIRSC